eukprot:CFRG5234T1
MSSYILKMPVGEDVNVHGKFSNTYPMQLTGIVDPEEFQRVVKALNKCFNDYREDVLQLKKTNFPEKGNVYSK